MLLRYENVAPSLLFNLTEGLRFADDLKLIFADDLKLIFKWNPVQL